MPSYLACHAPGARAHEALPAVPCSSPTTPSQPCLIFHRGHTLPAVPNPVRVTPCLPELAWPCLPKPCLQRRALYRPAAPSQAGHA
jgi:hypothetical protein